MKRPADLLLSDFFAASSKVFMLLIFLSLLAIFSSTFSYYIPPSVYKGLPSSISVDETLILFSLDGFRPDYLELGLTPTLTYMKNLGVSADFMESSFPSLTFPNHFSIATGLYPESHGIVANKFYDYKFNDTFSYVSKESNFDSKWWEAAEPIWITASKANVKSAVIMWPGSEVSYSNISSDYLIPFNMEMGVEEKMKQILDWLDLPKNERPRVIFVYVSEIDTAGHIGGPYSEGIRERLIQIDAAFQNLINGLITRQKLSSTNIFLVSDHGMAETSTDKLIVYGDLASSVDAQFINNVAILEVYPQDVSRTDEIFNEITLQLNITSQSPFKAYKRDESPSEYHYSHNHRIAPIYLLAEEGWTFSKYQTLPYFSRGAHGYDPKLESMHALFLAIGPRFKHGYRLHSSFKNVELYLFICKLMQIKPSANNGTLNFGDDFLKSF